MASRPVQHACGGEIHRETDRADDEHPAANHVRRVGEAAYSFHEDPDCDDDEKDAVRERSEDLRAAVAEAPLWRGRPRGEPGREQRERSEAASESMWPASASTASESASTPATTSTTMKQATSVSATQAPSGRREVSADRGRGSARAEASASTLGVRQRQIEERP